MGVEGTRNLTGCDRYYKALREITSSVNSASTAREVLDFIVKRTAKAMNAKACSLLFLDSSKKHLAHSAQYGLSDWYMRKGILDATRSLAESLEGKMVAIYDVAKDARLQYPELAQKAGISSILSVPLIARGDVSGTLRIYTRERRRFSRREREFLSTVAELGSFALESAGVSESLKGGHKELEKDLAQANIGMERLSSEVSKPITFAHPSEEEFAHLLDFYQIEWLYEPRSFALDSEGDKTAEMFTPDFYLPALDLYVELTTLKQRLVTEKNRKLRRLKELYPQINIRLLYKKDYHRLLAKYGYGPLAGAKVQGVERIFLSSAQIQKRVRQLGRQISKEYRGRPLILVGVLRGVVCFMADLMRQISTPVSVDFLSISYYSEDSSGAVRITKDLDKNITGQDVLMVEDIVDTGMTLNYIMGYLQARNPATLRVCALLDKRVRRLVDVPLAYVGFEIPDEFVVGFGLDYEEEYRNLPFIGILEPDSGETERRRRRRGLAEVAEAGLDVSSTEKA
ncbi:MAG: hypoxanthine phosphoribosyltransferase [Chloroflexota bacterium]